MSKSRLVPTLLMSFALMTSALAACPLSPTARRGGACQLPLRAETWQEVQRALGVYQAERFGRPGDCNAPARDLMQAWRLLRMVDLPGIGNAAEYVDRNISSLAYDTRLFGGVRALFVQGRDTLMLGPAFFDSPNASDAERAGTLLHEARHASDVRFRHVLCGAESTMAWTPHCDHRFVAAVDDAKAGAWSLEVVFHSLLREAAPCLDRELLARRIDAKLESAFRIVSDEQREALRTLVKAARAAKR